MALQPASFIVVNLPLGNVIFAALWSIPTLIYGKTFLASVTHGGATLFQTPKCCKIDFFCPADQIVDGAIFRHSKNARHGKKLQHDKNLDMANSLKPANNQNTANTLGMVKNLFHPDFKDLS